jgi:hypothetical protein
LVPGAFAGDPSIGISPAIFIAMLQAELGSPMMAAAAAAATFAVSMEILAWKRGAFEGGEGLAGDVAEEAGGAAPLVSSLTSAFTLPHGIEGGHAWDTLGSDFI